MIKKTKEKAIAIRLRKQGYSYSEILKKIKVAKSTLSIWLKEVQLAKPQKQRLSKKKEEARLKALKSIKRKRKNITKKLIQKGIREVGSLEKKDLFLIGIVLYWAEGSKQKENNVSQGVIFSNSDPEMIIIFIKWLKEFCKINDKEIVFSLYIHEAIKNHTEEVKNRWKKVLALANNKKINVCFKKNIIKRKLNIKNYYGVLRIRVIKSTNLNRLITGWTKGIINNFK